MISTFRLCNGPCRDLVEDEAVSFRRLEQGCLANPQAEGRPPLPVAPDGDDLDPRPPGLPQGLGFAPREELVGDRRRDRDLPQEVPEDEDFPDGLDGAQCRRVDPNAHGSALDPCPGSLPVPPQLVQRDSEEGDPFRGREIGHVPDGTLAYWAARLRVNSRFRYRARAFSVRRRRTPARRADLAISDRESRISCASSSRSSISSSSTRTWRFFI